MKSLYESLLGDMEDNMKIGNNYVQDIENEFKDFSKNLKYITKKNW